MESHRFLLRNGVCDLNCGLEVRRPLFAPHLALGLQRLRLKLNTEVSDYIPPVCFLFFCWKEKYEK